MALKNQHRPNTAWRCVWGIAGLAGAMGCADGPPAPSEAIAGDSQPLLWGEQYKLTGATANQDDALGISVAIDGDTALVGAHDANPNGLYGGSARVFVRSGGTWTEQQEIFPLDAQNFGQFGFAVGLSGDLAVAGDFAWDSGPNMTLGAAWTFFRTGGTWTEEAKLVASDGADLDYFGVSVAIDGGTVIVGAPLAEHSGKYEPGTAYIFVRSGPTWTQQQKLIAADTTDLDQFGTSVAIQGDTAVIGAGSNDDSAYVFVRSGLTWTQQQKLLPTPASADFGQAVAIDGDTIVVGAFAAAHVFVRSGMTWTEQQKLVKGGGGPADDFGTAVAISGNTVVVGARYHDPGATDAGAAYVFVRSGTTWTEYGKLTANDKKSGDELGISVGVSGATAIAGAWRDDIGIEVDEGSAYVFSLTPSLTGTACTAGVQCASGICEDGICCLMACGLCSSCDPTGTTCSVVPPSDVACSGACLTGACAAAGTCAPALAGTLCGVCAACDAVGMCSQAAADDPACGTIDCDALDGVCRDYADIDTGRCEGLGDCKDPNGSDCTVYTDVAGTCDDGDMCTAGDACVAGACVPGSNTCNDGGIGGGGGAGGASTVSTGAGANAASTGASASAASTGAGAGGASSGAGASTGSSTTSATGNPQAGEGGGCACSVAPRRNDGAPLLFLALAVALRRRSRRAHA